MFKVKHHGYFCTFLSEADLDSIMHMIQSKRQAL
jgi:hypothetical protein